MRRSSSTIWLWVVSIATPLAIVAAWWMLTADGSNPYFPPLSEVLVRFQELWLFDRFMSDVVPSLQNLVLGFLISIIGGVALGVLFAFSRPIREMAYPVLHFIRAVPPVAIIPIALALWGFGDDVRIFAIVLSALPPTLIATYDGVRSVDPQVLDVTRMFNIPLHQRITEVVLPAAGPQMFTGFQVSLQFSFVVLIATEMLGSARGIGAMTLLAQQTFMSRDMWAGVILLGIIGYLSNALLRLVRNRMLRWYDGSKAVQKS